VLVLAVASKAGVVRSALFPVTRGDIDLARSEEPGLRILFVGNSLTFYNEMPHMLHELAAGDPGAPPIFAVERTRNSWTLEGADDDKGLVGLLEDVSWDAVVLQERGWYLSRSEDYWLDKTYPYADGLRRKIAAAESQTVLFMTWGYEHGVGGPDSYVWMQSRLSAGYAGLASRLGVPVGPVGLAWADALKERPTLDLWREDGFHPDADGSYLAACVFFAELTGRDPAGSSFTAGLDPSEAQYLQEIAAETVEKFEELAPGFGIRLVERAGA
jgi:hypothetical protein